MHSFDIETVTVKDGKTAGRLDIGQMYDPENPAQKITLLTVNRPGLDPVEIRIKPDQIAGFIETIYKMSE